MSVCDHICTPTSSYCSIIVLLRLWTETKWSTSLSLSSRVYFLLFHLSTLTKPLQTNSPLHSDINGGYKALRFTFITHERLSSKIKALLPLPFRDNNSIHLISRPSPASGSLLSRTSRTSAFRFIWRNPSYCTTRPWFYNNICYVETPRNTTYLLKPGLTTTVLLCANRRRKERGVRWNNSPHLL